MVHKIPVRKGLFSWLLIFFLLKVSAQEFIPLWPTGKKPNFNGKIVIDSLYNERIWRVGTPGMYAFPVPKSENKGTTVLICPGGGYERLSHIYNGFQVARWFNTQGINAYVLIYRLPHQQDLQNREIAGLQDAQRAIKILRSHAVAWNLKRDKIGVMGVSAGGHLASMLGTRNEDLSSIRDSMDTVSFRPDFMVLLSPVISMGVYAHPGSKKYLLGPDTTADMIRRYSGEFQVSSFTPPVFMVHAQNDSTVSVQNSVMFYKALIDQKIPASIHIFPQGGHGIKLVDNPGSTDLWLQLLNKWLEEMKFTEVKKN